MRSAVVTGMGAITPNGLTVDALFSAVVSHHSAIAVLRGHEFTDLPVRIGAQIADFDPMTVLTKAAARRLSPVQHWAIAAADQAMKQAGLWDGDALNSATDPARIAIIVATGSGPIDAMQAATRAWDAGGSRAVPLSLAVYGSPDSAAAVLAQRYGVLGPAQGLSATCASSAIALGEGLRRIRHGYADTVLVVGMEDCLGPINLASNANMRALASGYEDDPVAACRPFDRQRSGFVMGQGAAAMVLTAAPMSTDIEPGAVTKSRPATGAGSGARDGVAPGAAPGAMPGAMPGAAPLAELAGFGSASDAYHPTAPHPAGRGAAAAIRQCLADAGIEPSQVDTVNAHATGTPAGDAAEIAALASVFGDHGTGLIAAPTAGSAAPTTGSAARSTDDSAATATASATTSSPAGHSPAITATKPVTGHLLGASGMVEAIIAVKSIETGLLPPIMNLADTEFSGWDFVTSEARRTDVSTVLSNSFGFGGHNGALLLRRWQK